MTATAVRKLGRFELLRELGRGAQATVWLAHDPRLEREVAVKLLKPTAGGPSVSACLQEARAVSRLNHPNIVPVFEADEHEGQAYLVFEYVEGPTLAQALKQQRKRRPQEAVGLVLGVLEALEVAHQQGLVHRDLKPSNILLGRDGRARVMDFGIAARATPGRDPGGGLIVGTPGYISPEAARGASPLPAMDVFAAGALLGEMLCGHALLQETDARRALQRVQDEDLLLPAETEVDALLRGIVQRSLSRELHIRYDSAGALHAALAAWLNPKDEIVVPPASTHATLEFLLRRMRHRTDFPALSGAVVRIQRVAASETETIGGLTELILKDVALTHKLLRVVNAAHYSAVAEGGVATVSRAVALVGFAGIRNLAMSLVLLEHMPDKQQATQLKSEFLRALLAGMLAAELAPRAGADEEAFLGALFQNLGRLLTEYYFPEEALQIRQVLAEDSSPKAREAAALRVLGIGFDELGCGVARAWGLPEALQRMLRAPRGELPSRPADNAQERARWLARSANALVDALHQAGPPQALQELAALHAPVLELSVDQVLLATQTARSRLADTARALGLSLPAAAPARRLLEPVPALSIADAATLIMGRPGSQAQALLAKGLERVRDPAVGRVMPLNELLQLVLETMHQALQMRHLIFCLREGATGRLVGRLGLGPGAAKVSAAFRITPDAAATGDLFAVLCAKGADLMVADSSSVINRLPAWYRQQVNAPTFLLLPLQLKGAPIGLIYADKAQAGSIVLGEKELLLLRALRDEAAQAFGRTQG